MEHTDFWNHDNPNANMRVTARRYPDPVVHIQASGRQVNRPYGAAENIDYVTSLTKFFRSLAHSSGVTYVKSLASDEVDYVPFYVTNHDNELVRLSTPVTDVEQIPEEYRQFVDDGLLKVEAHRYTLPTVILESLDL